MDQVKQITVIGQGYVGLPLSLSFAMNGVSVIGVDSNEKIVGELRRGITYQTEKVGELTIREILKAQTERGTYQVTTDGAAAIRASK